MTQLHDIVLLWIFLAHQTDNTMLNELYSTAGYSNCTQGFSPPEIITVIHAGILVIKLKGYFI